MKKIGLQQRELVDAVIAERDVGGLTAAIIEKDIHVTDALHALDAVCNQHASLVFCGGTSLSKAYAIIERMSEDIDLKVVLSNKIDLSRSGTKKILRTLKHECVDLMTQLGFVQDQEGSRTMNENRYVTTKWCYESYYASSTSLRPHLSLEFTVRTPQYPTQTVAIGYLVDQLAGQPEKRSMVNCLAVAETLAEKVLSFLRRYAQHRSGHMKQSWDSALVRHIYDIYCITRVAPDAIEKAKVNFPALVALDVQEFRHHPAFVQNPRICLSDALYAAEADDQTIHEYQTKLLPLIYGPVKPGFAEAFKTFKTTARSLLSVL
jgi:predicted nucleotidyltransferase component of viral defense system